MASPPPRHAATRQLILESAIFLMRQSGLTGAGINQILAHSRAPKGSMYYHFPRGKLQITSEALVLYGERVAAAMDAALSSKKRPSEKIRALFRTIAERLEKSHFEQSCAAGAVALDLHTEVADLGPVVSQVMESWQAVIARHLTMASRARRESFAGLVLSAIEGGYVRGRAERSSQALLQASEWLALMADQESA